MDRDKPGLMVAVMDGLKKKGKVDPKASMDEGDEDKDSSREHLEEVAKDLIAAIMDKDHSAVADLLEEAFQCCDSQPHEEGPHLDEDLESKDSKY